MLSRLASGEPSEQVWFRLWDKVYAPANLQCAFEKARRKGGCAGVDEQSLAQFARQEKRELDLLQEQLRSGTFRPHGLLSLKELHDWKKTIAAMRTH